MKTGCVLVGLAATASIAVASPITFDWTRVTSNAPHSVSDQWVVTSGDDGAGRSVFRFERVGSSTVALAQIYFTGIDDLLKGPQFASSAGVKYAAGANPAHPPGANDFDVDFAAGRKKQGGIGNAVNANGEWLEISFAIAPGLTQSDVAAGITAGTLRLAMHIQSIGQYSDTYINTPPVPPTPTPPPVIPLPAAVWSAGLGTIGVAGLVIRRRQRLSR